jgi:hypothetical protein
VQHAVSQRIHRGRRWVVLAVAASVLLSVSWPGSDALATYSAGPSVPRPLSPAIGAVSSENPVLEWAAAAGALKYTVSVRRVASPSPFPICGGETQGLRLTCDELPAGVYTWTVQAVGLWNRLSSNWPPRQFTKLPRLTTAPVITAPASGAVFDFPAAGLLRWTEVPNAAHYQLDISADPSFPGPDPDPAYAGIETNAAVIPYDIVNSTRYWRVRGVTESKVAAGPWSGVRSFTARWTETPALLTPADGAAISTVVLAWQPVAGAKGYEIQYDETTAFAAPVTDDSIKPWIEFATNAVYPTFAWRVRAINGVGARTDWSTPRSATIDTSAVPAPAAPPLSLVAPALTSPLDGAAGLDPLQTVISFGLVHGTVGYDLDLVETDQAWRVSDGGPPNHPGVPLLSHLNAGTTYRWRVRANASAGVYEAGPWSEERTFTTVPAGIVTLAHPSDASVQTNEDLYFTWTGIPTAPIYDVELSRNAAFTDAITLRAVADPRAIPRNALAIGKWYWRVRAGRENVSAVSATRWFELVDATAPVGYNSEPPEYTLADTIVLPGYAEDAVTNVERVAASADGVTWMEYAYGLQPVWSLVSDDHGGPDPGPRALWMRWRDSAGNWSEPLINRFWYGYPPPDTTPPVGTVVIEGGELTTTPAVVVAVKASDDRTAPRFVAISNDGTTWTERPYTEHQSWMLPNVQGKRTVYAKWKDEAGNWSQVGTDTIVLDTVASSIGAPGRALLSATDVISGAVRLRVAWTASDATSGIAIHQLQQQTDGGSWVTITSNLTTPRLDRSLLTRHTYRFRVRAIDRAGNASAWVAGPTISLSRFSEASARVSYLGTWSTLAGSAYWDGATRKSTSAGARASITFTGRSIGWVSGTGPTRGKASIYVNGVLRAMVDLYSPTYRSRRVVWVGNWSTSITRKVTVRVAGTSGRPRVDLDAFVTLN